MTCKIERLVIDENTVVCRVCGHIQIEHVNTIQDLIRKVTGIIALDLEEVTLVDRESVSFLAGCERTGIELRNCPAFLRDWIAANTSDLTEGE